VLEALGRGDALHEEAKAKRHSHGENEEDIDIEDELEGLYTEATTPVYSGSKMSVGSATIVIMNMSSVFRVSNTFTDELFRFLSGDLLPLPNKLPKTHYAARKSIHRLDLNYNNIHACPTGCILYDGEYATLDRCPKCTQRRWLDGTNNICRAPLHEECQQHHGHKGDPRVTPGTCGAIGERDQVIQMWVRAPGV
jgi:hypothetical protein